MVTITHTQTLWAADISELGQSARISISGDETNPTLVISDPNTGRILTTLLTNAPIDYSSFQIQSLSSDQGLSQIDLNGRSKALDTATIMRAGEDASEDATSEMTFLGRSGFIGDATHVLVINLGGIDYLYATDRVAGGVSVHQVDALGNLTSLSSVVDTATDKLAGISSLASIETGAGIFVVAASQTENALNLFQVGANGQLDLVDSISTDDLLPIDRPTDLATVTLSGTDYVLMTSYGSSSLTVFELTPAGELRFVTQANDALGTRFSGAMTLDTITLDGQVFVAVGGNDGGLTLFQLLPNGQLLLLATLVDTTETALENIEQLEFVVVDGLVELWAYTTGDAGLTRLNIDFGEIGITATGQDGTTQNDVLTAADTGGVINGYNGDDILIEGNGADTLVGGNGADVFVFHTKEGTDTVQDFNHHEDRIDLSAYETIKTIDDLSISFTSTGAIITHGDKTWVINTYNNTPLTLAQIAEIFIFSTDRVFIPEPAAPEINEMFGDDTPNEILGTDQNDQIYGLGGDDLLVGGAGADTLEGGSGTDTADYSDSLIGIDIGIHRVGVGGTAEGDQLIYIERIIGTDFDDTLVGGGAAAILEGGGGNDYLFDYGGDSILNGGAGDDYINGGAGADAIDGGEGIDTISYADTSSVYINLQTGVGQGNNAEGDTFVNVENVRGSNADDTIIGDAADNRIEGLDGDDKITGGGGNDYLIGGAGADVFIYDTTTFGRDLIVDWQDGLDKIDLRGSGLTFDDFTLVDTPQGTRLDYFNGTEIVAIHFYGIDPGQIDASDFLV